MFDPVPFGMRAPSAVQSAVLNATSHLPNNNLGLRLAMALRKIVMLPLGDGGLDVTRLDSRLRLYPRNNGCEKGLLFTPQMFDVAERKFVERAVTSCAGQFVFVDAGANVGLYSVFAARSARQRGIDHCVIAIEPQPGVIDRLRFNVANNPDLAIEIFELALSDKNETVLLLIDERDRGGTRIGGDGSVALNVEARTLLDVVRFAHIEKIDMLKIDVEGSEDKALVPFFDTAPESLWPQSLLIEDRESPGLSMALRKAGYVAEGRSKQNIFFSRPAGGGLGR